MPMAYKWVDLGTGTVNFTRLEDTAAPEPGGDYDEHTAGPVWQLRAVFWEEDDAES